MPAGQQAVQLVAGEEAGVPGGVTILVAGTRVTRGGAAFANAEMMLAGGKWDTFRMLTHPGTAIIPAALVAAEAAGASGRDFITGIVAGYEVMERMAADWIPTVMARGFHAGPVFSIFGAAIAAAKILRFDENQVHGVIALCTNWREAISRAAPCARAPRCETPCWPSRWRNRPVAAARPCSRGRRASTAPTPATTTAT